MNSLMWYLTRQREWSQRTFGAGCRTVWITKHIEKECQEIREAPTDLSEWIDVMILALDGYWRHGGTPESLFSALVAKQQVNFQRPWPTPGPEHEPVEHARLFTVDIETSPGVWERREVSQDGHRDILAVSRPEQRFVEVPSCITKIALMPEGETVK